ncbi:MAG: XRE family transcriptional regulator [Brevundimonas sp.]|nr:XRE family transcriptional regulator [Brevundimonas sp.]
MRSGPADPEVTGAQIRGARGLLNMSVAELSERTGLAINTIRKAEKTNGLPEVTSGNLRLIITTLEQAGILFVPADHLGAGVRLRDLDLQPLQRRREKSAE